MMPNNVKADPRLDMFWSIWGERHPWVWTGGPNAHDLTTIGGHLEIRPAPGSMRYAIPIGARVRHGQHADLGLRWVVSKLMIVGTRGAVEEWEDTDDGNFRRFADAKHEAIQLVSKAIAEVVTGRRRPGRHPAKEYFEP